MGRQMGQQRTQMSGETKALIDQEISRLVNQVRARSRARTHMRTQRAGGLAPRRPCPRWQWLAFTHTHASPRARSSTGARTRTDRHPRTLIDREASRLVSLDTCTNTRTRTQRSTRRLRGS